MLRPQYTRRPFNLMLIGPANSGKRTLAAQLLKTKDVFYSIHTAESVPGNVSERIDFILFLADMTQPLSLTLLKQCLNRMSDRYLARRFAIVATKVDKQSSWQFEKKDLQDMVELYYDVQVLYANLSRHSEMKKVADQLSRLIKIDTLQYRNVESMLIKSLEYFQPSGKPVLMDGDNEEGEDNKNSSSDEIAEPIDHIEARD